MNTVECEVWVSVDADGNYSVGINAEDAIERHESEYGAMNAFLGFRAVKVKLQVPLPKPIEVSCVIPDEQNELVAEVD